MRIVRLSLGILLAVVGCKGTDATPSAAAPEAAAKQAPEPEPEPEPEPDPEPEPEPQTRVGCSVELTVPTGDPIEVESTADDEAVAQREMLEQLCARAGRPGCTEEDFIEVRSGTKTSMTFGRGTKKRVMTRTAVYRTRDTAIRKGTAQAEDRRTACRQAWTQACKTAGIESDQACAKDAKLSRVDGAQVADLIGDVPEETDDAWPIGAPPHVCHVEVERVTDAATARGASTKSWAEACARALKRACADRPCGSSAAVAVDGIPLEAFPRAP